MCIRDRAGAAAPGALEWAGLVLVCLVLPAVISWAVAALMRLSLIHI